MVELRWEKRRASLGAKNLCFQGESFGSINRIPKALLCTRTIEPNAYLIAICTLACLSFEPPERLKSNLPTSVRLQLNKSSCFGPEDWVLTWWVRTCGADHESVGMMVLMGWSTENVEHGSTLELVSWVLWKSTSLNSMYWAFDFWAKLEEVLAQT